MCSAALAFVRFISFWQFYAYTDFASYSEFICARTYIAMFEIGRRFTENSLCLAYLICLFDCFGIGWQSSTDYLTWCPWFYFVYSVFFRQPMKCYFKDIFFITRISYGFFAFTKCSQTKFLNAPLIRIWFCCLATITKVSIDAKKKTRKITHPMTLNHFEVWIIISSKKTVASIVHFEAQRNRTNFYLINYMTFGRRQLDLSLHAFHHSKSEFFYKRPLARSFACSGSINNNSNETEMKIKLKISSEYKTITL